jgi:hypothetical protein
LDPPIETKEEVIKQSPESSHGIQPQMSSSSQKSRRKTFVSEIIAMEEAEIAAQMATSVNNSYF